ncbi:hypothetical protein M8J76_006734 [Diaphorina citri]|nr:hypothetical protein M8J76_006734 [Diaphorina citri]
MIYWTERTALTMTLLVIMATQSTTKKTLSAQTTTKRTLKPEHRQDHKPHEHHNKEVDGGHPGPGKYHDDEYTYEYETIEDEAPSITPEHHRQVPESAERLRENSGKKYTIDSAIVHKLKEEKKLEPSAQEMYKRNLRKVADSSNTEKDESFRGAKISEIENEDTSKPDGPGHTNAKSHEQERGESKIHEAQHRLPETRELKAKSHEGQRLNKTKDFTYEYESVDLGDQSEEGPNFAELRQTIDSQYTYEYETFENGTKEAKDKTGRKKEATMTSKELFDIQLAAFHAEQKKKRKLYHPEEYIDRVTFDAVNIKEIKDDTNETLKNYDENNNLRWRKEFDDLWPSTTTIKSEVQHILDAQEREEAEERKLDLGFGGDEDEGGFGNDEGDGRYGGGEGRGSEEGEHDYAEIARRARENAHLAGGTKNPQLKEINDLLDGYLARASGTPNVVIATTSTRPTRKPHRIVEITRRTTLRTTVETTLRRATPDKRTTLPKGILIMTTRSPAQRAERIERKLDYKRKLADLKQRRLKHENLFLKMRGFEQYTLAPTTAHVGLFEEDSFDREYFYLKSERAFNRWLRFNKYRFPQLNENKRRDYEILLRCWDTDIKKMRKGIPIVTLYPPPSTFPPSIEATTLGPDDYAMLGQSPGPPTTRRVYRDSLEEAFYRRYDELKHNRTFESLEKIIQEKEGPQYRAPQLDISEFSRRFWQVLLKEESRDFARKAGDRERLNRLEEQRRQHRKSIEDVASLYERQRWIRLQIKKQLETKSTTIDRRVELDEEGREWFKGVRGITGDLPDEFFLDDKTDLPKHLRWRVELPEKEKKRKVEKEKKRELELLEQGIISTTSDPLEIYKRLFKPLELPEWKQGLTTTTTVRTTQQATTETQHWFYSKYAKYELKAAYAMVPSKYLTKWMATWCPNLTDFYRIPDDYDPPEWQAKREEYIQYRRKKIKTTTLQDISSDEEWQTPYSFENFTYATMKITWDYVGPNQTMYFGLLAKAKDKVKDRVVLDSEYLDQMWDKTDSKLERFDIPPYQCLRCNQTFWVSEELNTHHKDHVKKEKYLEDYMKNNGSYTKRKKTVPPNKSYLFYYYSDAENMKSEQMFQPDYEEKEWRNV